MGMPNQSRRGFLSLAGAGLGAAWAQPAAAATQGEPDLVVFNANVLTLDAKAPRAEAFAVKGGRFIAVGRNEEMRPLIGPRTQALDAGRMTITPGFIDCHNHAGGEVLLFEVLVGNPYEVEFVTIASIVDKLRAKAKTLAPDTWVEGYFFDDTKVKDGRLIDVHDLDKVSTEHPVVVRHRGGHTSFYNSRALALAGVTKATPNPPGGTFDKGPNGELNGRVTDRATAVFAGVGQRQTFTPQETSRRARTRRPGLHLQASSSATA